MRVAGSNGSSNRVCGTETLLSANWRAPAARCERLAATALKTRLRAAAGSREMCLLSRLLCVRTDRDTEIKKPVYDLLNQTNNMNPSNLFLGNEIIVENKKIISTSDKFTFIIDLYD